MRSFVGFARADEVLRWGWGRYIEEVLDDFEQYLCGILDEEDVLEVIVLVKVMVRTVGYVPRPEEVSRYYIELGERLASSDWLASELAKRYGGSSDEWKEFLKDFNAVQARRYARASKLYWDWVDGGGAL